MLPKIESIQAALALFPRTASQIHDDAQKAIQAASQCLAEIYAIDSKQRTFDNTAAALDRAVAQFSMVQALLYVVEMVHNDPVLRKAAHEEILKLSSFSIDHFGQNIKLYDAFNQFMLTVNRDELNAEENYYLDEMMKAFQKSGLHLDPTKQELLKDIKKELSERMLIFDRNIALDNRFILVHEKDLLGLSEEFVESLKREGTGPSERFMLGIDYPTVDQVMSYCVVESTRHALWKEAVNRAYPVNKQVLEDIIALRDKMAQLLGYTSYAELDIEDQTAENLATVEKFLQDLLAKTTSKALAESNKLKEHMPSGVELTLDGKFKLWDYQFVKSMFKKDFMSIDEEEIARYFPLEHTLEQLLIIYEQFLDLKFEREPAGNAWDETVEAIKVKRDGKLLGILFLDLFPRENKYNHACFIDIVPTVKNKTGFYPGIGLVIANFPKPTADRPALLGRHNVITFFHEFGHAVHGLLGSTQMAGFSGTNVKRDFVEMPSQMLEEWMWDLTILTKISKNYKTGEPLSRELIERIIASKHFDTGHFLQRQLFFAKLSLAYFREGPVKNLFDIEKKLFQETLSSVAFNDQYHFYASFGHLTGYSAKYYGYLWSKVFALDMFEQIRNMGLLNPQAGKLYVDKILSKGGSAHPSQLMRDFLGRDPQSDAFLKDLGIW